MRQVGSFFSAVARKQCTDVSSLNFELYHCCLIDRTFRFVQGSEARFREEWKPLSKVTWRARAAAVLVGRACDGRWVDYAAEDDSCPRSRFVGRFGLLFEALRPPSDAQFFVLGSAQEDPSLFTRDGTRYSNDERSRTARGKPKRDGEIPPSVSALPRQTAKDNPGGSPASPIGGLRALVRMLRTCHVGAVLAKRLIFGALLGAAGRRATGAAPSLAHVWALLLTSVAFATWLVVGRPYVSRAIQGIEVVTALLELLTLCLALQSGRAELKASQNGTVTEESVRAFGTAMLVFQMLAIAAQVGYQWWAVYVELRARWGVWAQAREQAAVAEKRELEGRALGLAKGKQRRGTRGRVPSDGRSRELAGMWPEESRSGGQPNGRRNLTNAHVRRERGAAKVATSPPPVRGHSSCGAEKRTRGLHRGGLKRRISRGEEHANGETQFKGLDRGAEEHRRGGVRKRAELDGRSERRTRERKGGRNGADILDEVVTRGTSDGDGAYWQEARIREWAGQSADNPIASRADMRGVRFDDTHQDIDVKEDPGALNGLARVLKLSGEAMLARNSNGSFTEMSGPENLISRMREGGMQKLLRLKSRRQERGLSSMTVFVVSEADSDEEEGAETKALPSGVNTRANLSAFTF